MDPNFVKAKKKGAKKRPNHSSIKCMNMCQYKEDFTYY